MSFSTHQIMNIGRVHHQLQIRHTMILHDSKSETVPMKGITDLQKYRTSQDKGLPCIEAVPEQSRAKTISLMNTHTRSEWPWGSRPGLEL